MTGSQGQVVGSIKITFLATLAASAIQALALVVLARLLSPSNYGDYAATVAIVSLTSGLVASVIERALVVSEGDGALRGAGLAVPCFVAAASITLLAVLGLGRALGIGTLNLSMVAIQLSASIVLSFAIVPRVILRRRISFGRIVIAELAGQIFGTAGTAILLATLGFGRWSLSSAVLIQSIVVAAALITTAPRNAFWPPAFSGPLRQLRHSWRLANVGALEVVYARAPVLLIGSQLGVSSLGIYNRANSLIQLPTELLTYSLSRVVISKLVSVSDSVVELRRVSSRLFLTAAAIITPLAAGMAFSGGTFVSVILGPRWIAAEKLVPCLSLIAWISMITHLFGVLSEATRKFSAKFYIQSFGVICIILFMAWGGRHGLLWSVFGLSVAGTIMMLFYVNLAARILETSVWQIASLFVPGLGGGAVAGVFAYACVLLRGDKSDAIVLTVQIAGCGIFTALFYAIFFRRVVLEFLQLSGLGSMLIGGRFSGRP